MFKGFLYSLTGKLIVTIGALMVVGSALFWYFLISHEESDLIKL
jgi:plastocyanin domain-containing protein